MTGMVFPRRIFCVLIKSLFACKGPVGSKAYRPLEFSINCALAKKGQGYLLITRKLCLDAVRSSSARDDHGSATAVPDRNAGGTGDVSRRSDRVSAFRNIELCANNRAALHEPC